MDITLTEAKVRLGELVELVAQGEAVRITRRGKPVARITGLDRQPKNIDLTALRALTDALPPRGEPPGTWLRSIRDESRY